MKKTKKLCSFLLTAALLLTVVVIPGSALNTKQVIKQDFESWSTEDLKVDKLNDTVTIAEVVEADSTIVKSGKALKFTSTTSGGLTGVRISNEKLKAGATYTLSFKLYRAVTNNVHNGSYLKCGTSDAAYYVSALNGNTKDIYCYTNYQNSQANSWWPVTTTFTAANNAQFAFIYQTAYNNESLYIDDITITEVAPVVVDFYDSTEKINQLKGMTGSKLNLPSAPEKDGYTFEGWYTDSDCTAKATATSFPETDTNFYAKYTSAAITQDFESMTTLKTANANGSGISVALVSNAEDNVVTTERGKALRFQVNDTSKAWLYGVQLSETQLKVGATYKMTFDMYYKTTATSSYGKNLKLSFCDTSGNFNYQTIQNHKDILAYSAYCTGSYPNNWLDIQKKWNGSKNVDLEFTASGKYLILVFEGASEKDLALYLDNITITEVNTKTDLETAVESNMSYTGTAVRPATGTAVEGNNGQIAIRFKSAIAETAVTNGITVGETTYTVEEYGHLYFKKEFLTSGAELTVESTHNSKTAFKAVAYNKTDGTDTRFATADGNIYFTLALYGIKDTQLDTGYVARPYVILKATDGTETTLYGSTTQSASLAEVAETAYYAQPGDIYNISAAYTDTAGYSWSETYTVRKGLYESVLNVLSDADTNYKYLAPAAAKQ